MDIQALKQKVLIMIDEADTQPNDIADRYSIEEFLDSAAIELMQVAPLAYLTNALSFSEATINALADGSGEVELPIDFMRVLEFKMKGWTRSVLHTLVVGTTAYNRQKNKFTRGGKAKPQAAVVVKGGKKVLEYYSLTPDDPPVIEVAQYLPVTKACNVPDALVDALCCLAASLILSAANEASGATIINNRYKQLMLQLQLQ